MDRYPYQFDVKSLINIKETAQQINRQYKRGFLAKAEALELIKTLVFEANVYMEEYVFWTYHDGFLKP